MQMSNFSLFFFNSAFMAKPTEDMASGFISFEDEEMFSQNRMRSKSVYCTKKNCDSKAVYFYPSRCLKHLGICCDCRKLHAMFCNRCDSCRNLNNESRKKLRRTQKKSSGVSSEIIWIE